MPLQSILHQNTGVVVILSTAPDLPTARTLASTLVESGLAACVNILPGVESIYRWEGKIETAAEYLLLVKTAAEHQTALLEKLSALHPYQVPEGLAFPAAAGLLPYCQWVREGL